VRALIGVLAAMAGFLSLLAALDLLAGIPLGVPARFSLVEAMHFNNLLNRNLNQLVAVVFMTVAIAVPLAANLYSLRFLEFFVKDPVNAFALLLVVLVDAANTWAGYRMREGAVTALELHVLFYLTMLCFAVLIPYLYYIFRFLHPSTLLDRLERDVRAGLRVARSDPERGRQAVAVGLEHLGSLAIRSLERGDRTPAVASVDALGRIMKHYWELKPALPRAWLTPDQHHFLGFSEAALAELCASGTWVEMKLYGQLHQIVGAAIGRQPDLTATVASELRDLGLAHSARADAGVRELTIEHFNTLLRLTLNRRETRGVFAILDQYRQLAESLNRDEPQLGEEIAYYIAYYGGVARGLGLAFLAEAAAYDLAALVRSAWQVAAPNRDELLARFLRYGEDGGAPLKGVLKARAILASFFALRGESEALATVTAAWRGLDAAVVTQVRDELLAVTREKYWEVSDRRVNVDWVPEAQRARLAAFFAELAVLPRAGA
jgi:hypothetical protein